MAKRGKYVYAQRRRFVHDKGSGWNGEWTDWLTYAVALNERDLPLPSTNDKRFERRLWTDDCVAPWEYNGRRDQPKNRRGRCREEDVP